MKNYIGLATSAHDTSLAIVDRNGQLVHAEGAERPLQSKRAWGNAPDHINYIQDLVSQYCDPSLNMVVGSTWSKYLGLRYGIVLPIANYQIRNGNRNQRNGYLTLKYMGLAHKSVLNLATAGLEFALQDISRIERRYYNHHLTHAASAAFASPFTEGICAVIDGYGESSAIAAFQYRDGKLKQIRQVKSGTSSLGFFYADMCYIAGFDPLKGEEWKLMGLAAYGKFDRKLYDLMRPLLKVNGLRLENGKNISANINALQEMRRKPEVAAIEYADFAATAQFVFTESVHQLLRNLHALKISDNLILSGGCALNSSANGTILENTSFKELFINSAPADDGNAIGAAYLAYYADNPYNRRGAGVLTPYLGTKIGNSGLERLRQYGGLRSEELDEHSLCRTVAKALADGRIVGWMQGRAEFGPRALGNRSILADPRKKAVKDRLNAEVKFREEFRPFAPSILHEYGDAYFENYQYSPYMERTLRFKESMKAKVAGVVHEDGTGRLQSVTPEMNLRYYRLIKAFHDITGVPILLNTSFNVMGKPIVHSVEDAVAVFKTSGLDLLVIDNVIFLKHAKDDIYLTETMSVQEEKMVEA